jgi:hypothetical protein
MRLSLLALPLRSRLALPAAAALALLLAIPGHAKPLEVGDPVPDFLLIGAGGTEYRAVDFKGRRAFVFAWFPLAFTAG